MIKRKLNVVFSAGFGLFCFAQITHAEDFNFTVPVRVSNLPPNVTNIMIRCSAVTLPAGAAAPTSQIGMGTVFQPISSGAYTGSVVVRFNASPDKLPASATHYQCWGQFAGSDRGFSVGYFINGGQTGSTFPLAAGAPFNLRTDYLPLPR